MDDGSLGSADDTDEIISPPPPKSRTTPSLPPSPMPPNREQVGEYLVRAPIWRSTESPRENPPNFLQFPSTRFSYHILCVCSSPFSLLQLHLMYLQCHHLLVCMRIEDTIKHKQYAVVLEVVVLHLLIFSSAFPSRHSFLQLKLFGSFNSLDWIDASSTESMVDT